MPSARPISGASSTEPLTSITSTWRPVAFEVALGDPRVLGRDPHHPQAPLGLAQPRVAPAAGEHHAAAAEAEVEQLVDDAVGLLEQDVLAGDADVGGAGLDVGRHVGGPHRHQRDLLAGEDQRPRLAAHRGGVDPGGVEQVEGALEQRAARHRQLQRPARPWCRPCRRRRSSGSAPLAPLLLHLGDVDALQVEGEAGRGQVERRSA